MTKKTGESKGCGFLEFDNQEGYWVSESHMPGYLIRNRGKLEHPEKNL